jgi:DNA repair exonuclease SbcCD nuclease subunit
MIIGVYTDAHFTTSTSILNNLSGYNYSSRLDLLVQSFKWMYEVFKQNKVSEIYNLGDLLDHTKLTSRELSALSDALSYNTEGIPEYHLVGNHDKDSESLDSVSIIGISNNIHVINSPTNLHNGISMIPYTEDYSKIDLDKLADNSSILMTHLTYSGMKVGSVDLSGASQEDYCSRFQIVLNGHVHTASAKHSNQVYNVGSFFGYGFGDDYSHSLPCILILDTDNPVDCKRIVNPYACLFYKTKVRYASDIVKLMDNLVNIPNPKCLRLEVPYPIRDNALEILESYKSRSNLLDQRIRGYVTSESSISDVESSVDSITDEEDHIVKSFSTGLEAFKSYVNNQSDNDLPYKKSRIDQYISEYLTTKKVSAE